MEDGVLFNIIEKMLGDGKFSAIRNIAAEMNVVDIAQIISRTSPENQVKLFRLLPTDISAETFSYLESDIQSTIVDSITNTELGKLVEEMFIDDAVDFLEDVPANVVTRVLANTSTDTRKTINRFLNYPEDSAGSIMTAEMAAFDVDCTVEDAISDLRRTALDKESIETCYCIDKSHILTGYVPLRKLIVSKPSTKIGDIMYDDEQLIYVRTTDDQETVAQIVRKYDLLSVPVVDKNKKLVGIITVDDIVDVIQQENTEDFEKMALLIPSEEDYMKTGVVRLFLNRIPWLLILMVSATFTGFIIDGFEDKLAAVAGLTACIPMLMDTGGNSGNQVSTLIIRGLALGTVRVRDYFRVLWKELRVALMCGATLAVANFARMYLLNMVTHSIEANIINTFLVVCISMLFTVVVAKVIGCSLPMVAKLLHLDPALMAGPMITTIVDAITLLIYFGFASAVLFPK